MCVGGGGGEEEKGAWVGPVQVTNRNEADNVDENRSNDLKELERE